jgi:hypothetical protein
LLIEDLGGAAGIRPVGRAFGSPAFRIGALKMFADGSLS